MFISNQKGLGLVEVMIAAAILGAISVAVMKVNQQGIQGVSRVEKRMEINDVYRELLNVTASKVESCSRLLGQQLSCENNSILRTNSSGQQKCCPNGTFLATDGNQCCSPPSNGFEFNGSCQVNAFNPVSNIGSSSEPITISGLATESITGVNRVNISSGSFGRFNIPADITPENPYRMGAIEITSMKIGNYDESSKTAKLITEFAYNQGSGQRGRKTYNATLAVQTQNTIPTVPTSPEIVVGCALQSNDYENIWTPDILGRGIFYNQPDRAVLIGSDNFSSLPDSNPSLAGQQRDSFYVFGAGNFQDDLKVKGNFLHGETHDSLITGTNSGIFGSKRYLNSKNETIEENKIKVNSNSHSNFIFGGSFNEISLKDEKYSEFMNGGVVIGGTSSLISRPNSSIISSFGSAINLELSTVASNDVMVKPNPSGGSMPNSFHFIAGGGINRIHSGYMNSITGGFGNTIKHSGCSFISNNFRNVNCPVTLTYNYPLFGSIFGGVGNIQGGSISDIIGGMQNSINSRSFYSSIVGGYKNEIDGGVGEFSASSSTNFIETHLEPNPSNTFVTHSMIVSGIENKIKSHKSMILNGQNSEIQLGADKSVLIGKGIIKSNASGSFLVTDSIDDNPVEINRPNLFKAKFENGFEFCLYEPCGTFRFNPYQIPKHSFQLVKVPVAFAAQTQNVDLLWGSADMVFIWGEKEVNLNSEKINLGQEGSTIDITGDVKITGKFQIGNDELKLGGTGLIWRASDRNLKSEISDINEEDLLIRLANLPISSWKYIKEIEEKNEFAPRHIGPMAQDFYEFFSKPYGFSSHQTAILESDINGVLMASTKALEARTRKLQEEIETLKNENNQLRAKFDNLLERLEKLEAKN